MTMTMDRVIAGGIALAALAATPASAQASAAAVPESIALFYDALTAAPGKDVAGLIARATSPAWTSCGGNDACAAREQVVAAIAARQAGIPDIRWELKEVLVSGDRVVVRSEASGTPSGDFMGVPHGGRSFKLMSIDVHTLDAGKLVRSYHVEDWMGAVRQLSAK
jgi:predicted ester cyclase